MRMERFTYAQAESCLYEGMRWRGKNGKILAEREDRSRIDESMTGYNVCYVKECLMPDKKFRSKRYAKEHRGEAIAEYHNSQVSSQSRAMMSGQRASNAIGVVATLPRDNLWLKRAELTDEEYEYLRDKIIEKPHDSTFHRRDEVLEMSVREKFTRVRPTGEEMERSNAFLLAVKDAWLDVCNIRPEDVLFFAIHWDESFPHVHVLALPTVEKTYEADVYSKRTKKDGTHMLLHKAGEISISYSVSRFYENAYYDENGKRHYPFMESYHQDVIDRMQNNPELSDEIRQTADKLLNGATQQRVFTPRDFNREQREESVFFAEASRILDAKNAEKDKEIDKKNKKIEQLTSDAKAMQEEFDEKKAFLQKRLDDAQNEAKTAEEMAETLQAQEIYFRREISSLRTKMREIILTLKDVANKVVEDALTRFVPLLHKAKSRAEEEAVDMKAKASISDTILHHVVELEAKASAILEADSTREVNLSMFTITPQRYRYAISQIKKAAQRTRYNEEFTSITNETAENNPFMKLCLEDWFDKKKYATILSAMTKEDEVEYMKSPVRAARAIECLDACVEAGLVELDSREKG